MALATDQFLSPRDVRAQIMFLNGLPRDRTVLDCAAVVKLIPSEVLEALAVMFPEIERDVLKGYVDKFARLFIQSIYKWVQSPLCLHVGSLDLDRERALQMPVVQKNEWT